MQFAKQQTNNLTTGNEGNVFLFFVWCVAPCLWLFNCTFKLSTYLIGMCRSCSLLSLLLIFSLFFHCLPLLPSLFLPLGAPGSLEGLDLGVGLEELDLAAAVLEKPPALVVHAARLLGAQLDHQDTHHVEELLQRHAFC